MKAIFSSRFYISADADQREKIHAALDSPLNKELVTQLHEYLDESDTRSDEEMLKTFDEPESDESDESNESGDEPDIDSDDSSNINTLSVEDDEADIDDDNVDDTTNTSIDSDGDIAESIKSMLNDNPTTSGVSRIAKKNSELWIYYNDDTNLNSVMSDVIDAVTSDNTLKFSRLARTDNAVVFDI